MKHHKTLSDVQHMFDHLSQCLEDWEEILPKPSHTDLVSNWKDTMKSYIEEVSPDENSELVETITSGLLEAYSEWTSDVFTDAVSHDQTHALMQRPQTTQRSFNWYAEFKRCLTASEIYKVFGSPRERGTLVMQKSGNQEMPVRNGPSVCYREAMAPFDWGICFEPVVKQILELHWDAMIHECGRFVHLTDTRLAASPDGLIIRARNHPEMAGHLVEIKCPKSRKIGLKVPMEYYYQMQLQLEVTGVRACEYVEAKFEMVDRIDVKPASGWYGIVGVVGCFNETSGEWLPCKYVYGPIGDLTWKPDLGLNEQTLQLNKWVCEGFHHERILRDEAWFKTLIPKLEEFWADVEKAKVGEFILPESSRKKKETVCLIVEPEVEPQVEPEPELELSPKIEV